MQVDEKFFYSLLYILFDYIYWLCYYVTLKTSARNAEVDSYEEAASPKVIHAESYYEVLSLIKELNQYVATLKEIDELITSCSEVGPSILKDNNRES